MENDEDMRVLERHVAQMMEHFDSVQIFATKACSDGTISATKGAGNWFARRGQITEWMIAEDEVVRMDGRKEHEA